VRIDFTVDDVHPVKYIYSVQGTIEHSFANEDEMHLIEQYQCAIIASKSKSGHILFFKKDTNIEVVSLEIDRKTFLVHTECEVEDLAAELQELYQDTTAKKAFYHKGFFGLDFKNLLDNMSKYSDKMLIRKYYLESVALQIFVNQLLQFEDDLLKDSESSILRINELKRIEDISQYIKDNLTGDLSINSISKKTGLNPNKLQLGFKYIHGSTINEFVTKARLDKALQLLQDPNLNVSDVVHQVGFDSKSYFSKIFKKKFELTPSAYKQICLRK
jgi:AraC-like DNA-binding protein